MVGNKTITFAMIYPDKRLAALVKIFGILCYMFKIITDMFKRRRKWTLGDRGSHYYTLR